MNAVVQHKVFKNRPEPQLCVCGVAIEADYLGLNRWSLSDFCSNCKAAAEIVMRKQKAAQQMKMYQKEKAQLAHSKIKNCIPPLYRAARIGKLGGFLSQKIIATENVFMWGGCGVGKTYAGMALLRYYAVYGRSVGRIVFENLLSEIRRFGKTEDEILEPFFNVDFLLIDDIGLSDKDFSARVLFRLIDTRMESKRKTFLTSNLTIEELGPLVGSRTISRLLTYDIIKLIGVDRRNGKR